MAKSRPVAVYDAMSLARRPGDRVEKEYKVHQAIRVAGTSGPAMDIVYIQQAPEPPQQVFLTDYFVDGSCLWFFPFLLVLWAFSQERASARVGVGKN